MKGKKFENSLIDALQDKNVLIEYLKEALFELETGEWGSGVDIEVVKKLYLINIILTTIKALSTDQQGVD